MINTHYLSISFTLHVTHSLCHTPAVTWPTTLFPPSLTLPYQIYIYQSLLYHINLLSYDSQSFIMRILLRLYFFLTYIHIIPPVDHFSATLTLPSMSHSTLTLIPFHLSLAPQSFNQSFLFPPVTHSSLLLLSLLPLPHEPFCLRVIPPSARHSFLSPTLRPFNNTQEVTHALISEAGEAPKHAPNELIIDPLRQDCLPLRCVPLLLPRRSILSPMMASPTPQHTASR